MNPNTKKRALVAAAWNVRWRRRRRDRLLHDHRLGHGHGHGRLELAVTFHATVSSNLYPAQLAGLVHDRQPLPGAQRVGTITLASISVDAAHSACSTAISGGNPDFTMPAVTVNQVFPVVTARASPRPGP